MHVDGITDRKSFTPHHMAAAYFQPNLSHSTDCANVMFAAINSVARQGSDSLISESGKFCGG